VHLLSRNRDFVLLQLGQSLSSAGTQLTTVAYPLLALGVSGSAAQAGAVGFARLAPSALFALLAGVAADHWSRKALMIAADAVRALAMAALGVAVATGHVTIWAIAIVALLEGTASTFFIVAEAGAFRSVVPRVQLPAAVGAQEAQRATVRLVGPALGGALYGVSRALPFLANAVSYTFSTLSLLAMRTVFQERRPRETASLRTRIAEGLRFLWKHPFLRATALLYGIGNFLVPGIFLTIVVLGREQGLTSARIGVLSALFAAGTLAGSLLSPYVRRALSVRTILVLELWTWLALWAFVAWPNVYVLTAALTLFGIAAPSTDSVVHAYRLAMTPDRLVGRVESVRSNISLLLSPLGPLVAGALLASTSARYTVAAFAVLALMVALWGTLSPPLRAAPRLEELAEPGPG
jgi:MFS family permease